MKRLLIFLLLSISSLFAFENLTANNFDKEISNKNVIVDFYYNGWPSCEALGQSLTKYNASKSNDVKIYKVNLGEEMALAKRFNIRSFPVIIYFKDGEAVFKERGIVSAEELKLNVMKYFH